MAGIVHSIEELVGRTPLMELDRFERQQQCGAHLLAKLEFFNPTGSVKDRAALSMIQAAEASGHLAPGEGAFLFCRYFRPFPPPIILRNSGSTFLYRQINKK